MATTIKKKDDELSYVLVGCGIFTLALVIIDFFAAKWSIMNGWILILVIVLHGLTAFAWYKVLKNWKDPNYDYWRKIVIAAAVVAILVIMGHRAGWIEEKMFQETLQENKVKV